jgi:hypothetical protein
VDRARGHSVRQRQPRAPARRRDDSLETGLSHPAFEPLRRWFDRLTDPLRATLDDLNGFASEAGVRVESGQALRFVPPGDAPGGYGDYEIQTYQTGRVATRPESLHDLFNALAWLAFPRTKARLNALHAREIPREQGRRGRLRDLLTLLDEGGAIVACDDPQLVGLVHGLRWKELFWDQRPRLATAMRVSVLGHAVYERALEPWPGITCKALFVPASGDADAHAAAWLAALPADASPRALPPLPVFGYPGWHPGSVAPEFYDDDRYFRGVRTR